MRAALELEFEDWETLCHLVKGRRVIQAGIADGFDTVNLARAAAVVVTVPAGDGGELEEIIEANAAVMRAASQYGVLDKVIRHQVLFTDAVQSYCPDVFDVAVINPMALGGELIDTYVSALVHKAEYVALIESPTSDSWQAMTRLCPRPQWSTTKSGRVIVSRHLQYVPSEDKWR